ncbi:MAG TPA: chromate resistance protein ChrB domain-containing protein [Streptosporangiaceae bacterium]
MKWITRARPKTDRIACPWLITKFIDPDAEILYVPADQVLDSAGLEDAISFDAPGARYTHRDGKCTFEVLIEDHHLDSDPALMRLAKIVHAADIADDLDTDPAGPGLLAIGLGGLDVEADDHRLLERGRFVYDALYAWCQRQELPRHEPHHRLWPTRAGDLGFDVGAGDENRTRTVSLGSVTAWRDYALLPRSRVAVTCRDEPGMRLGNRRVVARTGSVVASMSGWGWPSHLSLDSTATRPLNATGA